MGAAAKSPLSPTFFNTFPEMNITIIGYGKMGHEVEQIALSRGHNIMAKLDKEWSALPKGTDVVIEFSRPEAAVHNITQVIQAGVPIVSGTTGWLQNWEKVKKLVMREEGALFYASNYSVGVYLFRKLTRKLAKMMAHYPNYLPSIEEVHHIHKLDYPSGTALSIAEDIQSYLKHLNSINAFLEPNTPTEIAPNQLPIASKREGEVPGTHTVYFSSSVDTISITHEAKGRGGFALGAVLAAEFLLGKKGIFGMKDLIKSY